MFDHLLKYKKGFCVQDFCYVSIKHDLTYNKITIQNIKGV